MMGSNYCLPGDRTAWLLAIGRRLRAEYDAIAEPLPPRLAALIKQVEMPAQEGLASVSLAQQATPRNVQPMTVAEKPMLAR